MGRDKYFRPSLVIKLNNIGTSQTLDFNSAVLYLMVQVEDLMFYPGKVESWIILVDCG
jgi:hypothetical protein